ncbi:MAG TPA: hypothetical protein VKT75_07395 [Acidobacteriaceae bacterium]|nr:hypothetical protein [Acidobacteriaceae bacterium]
MLPVEARPDIRKGPPARSSELHSDSRWRLIERILLTAPFQSSSNLHALLYFLAERSIQSSGDPPSERQIGIAVFGKPADYSPAEDSAVRVHVRQLRLRLHEYFAQEGRNETLRVEIPKRAYALEFHEATSEVGPHLTAPLSAPPKPVPERPAQPAARNVLLWIAIAATAVCALGWYRAARGVAHALAPWPLGAVIQQDQQTRVVVSDSSLMLRLLGQHEITLDEYLQPGYPGRLIPTRLPENFQRLTDYISQSQLASFADLSTIAALMKVAGPLDTQLVVTSARDLNRRDLEHGNYIFVGSPTSNPWVALFSDKLNFEEVEQDVGGRIYFLNRHPLPGEKNQYEGLATTGSTGEDYATISVLPGPMAEGNVMVLQGLRQEGTEALSALLADADDRDHLQNAVRQTAKSSSPYFEALVRSHAVAGAPVSVTIVAVRSIEP